MLEILPGDQQLERRRSFYAHTIIQSSQVANNNKLCKSNCCPNLGVVSSHKDMQR